VREVLICGAVRTPFGRYAGLLSGIRANHLAATTTGVGQGIAMLIERLP
jgi:acetyl-CoA acetyltransferase